MAPRMRAHDPAFQTSPGDNQRHPDDDNEEGHPAGIARRDLDGSEYQPGCRSQEQPCERNAPVVRPVGGRGGC